MKLSLKFPDGRERRRSCHLFGTDDSRHEQQPQRQQPLLKAKVPITVLSQPFATAVTATTTAPSDLTLSLLTNFPSGPSLKLSYSPSATPSSASPFSVTLKSGLGLFGSPKESPLTFSAHFSFSPSLNHPTPVFSLRFKPQIGHFSFRTCASSNPKPSQIPSFKPSVDPDSSLNGGFLRSETLDSEKLAVRSIPHFAQPSDQFGSDPNGGMGTGFKSTGGPVSWEELKLEPCIGRDKGSTKPSSIGNLNFAGNCRGDVLSAVSFRASTELPITKRARMNFHWGVNLPADSAGLAMPYLTVQKIGFERDVEVKNLKAETESSSAIPVGGSELLKGLCLWMRRDLEVIQRENEEMKQYLVEMRSGIGNRASLSPPSSETKRDFETWRSTRSGREENGTGSSRTANRSPSVETELRRAIKSSST